MRRFVTAASVSALLAASVLAGCGGGSQPDPAAAPPVPTGEGLQQSLQQAIPGSAVTAQVSGKTITLTGTVKKPYEVTLIKSQAETLAPGYTIVNNVRSG